MGSGVGRPQANLDDTVPLDGVSLEGDRGDGEQYCFCGEPWRGGYMVECDECGEWFHGECVNLSEDEEQYHSQEGMGYHCLRCAWNEEGGGDASGDSRGKSAELSGGESFSLSAGPAKEVAPVTAKQEVTREEKPLRSESWLFK